MKAKNKKIILSATISMVVGAITGSLIYYKHRYKMPLKDYTKASLYMAVMDDEISRKVLEGCTVNGVPIELLPKRESLQYRYHLFLELNRGKKKDQIETEIVKLERRLENLK